ncbi:uncharacterized protein DDB_G0284459 isoform X2 [Tetranychus urticae]|uniref:uncharacterized protein DDB_G0284459 isoform X2 n=1 Tax=Tetranychus urticae TaxID=32264 RepID=UPI00077BE4D8|nr:uncharacterized protein DDB_G0284459 isoform X2 [Tetranychus urticae]
MKNYVSIRAQVIHEKSSVSDSPSRSLSLAFGDDKHNHKSSKSISRDVTGEKKKSSKMASVISSKDKSLHSQQSSSNQGQSSLSSSSSTHHTQISSFHEKSVNSSGNIPLPPSSSSSQSVQDPFTDLFGTPIKTRPSPDSIHSKLKDNSGSGSGTSKSGLSSLKASSKKISTDIKSVSGSSTKSLEKEKDKEKKHKITPNGGIVSSKDIKIEKDAKPSKEKSLKKRDESPKIKKEKLNKPNFDGRPTTPNLSASSSSKKSTSLPNVTSVKKEPSDTSGNTKEGSSSKKRKRSLSPPSFLSGETGEKKDSGIITKSISKDGLSEKSHKEKSKKQKASTRDQVSSSATVGSNSNHKVKDVKKESSTSTTISLTNNENTGTTTLEIKSVKKEKTWDSEVKKSRSKEHKTDEVKSSRENVSKDSNKIQVRDKELLKEKEKEQPQPQPPEKKEKEKNKEKSSKNRDRDRDRDREKDREKDKDKEKEKSKDKDKEKLKDRSKDKDNSHDDSFSPKESTGPKFAKFSKDKYHGGTLVNNNHNLNANVNSLRDPSSSPASIVSGSLTPGGGAYLGAPSSVSSLNGPITTLMAEMDQESLPVSPLSSCDPPSPLTFGSKDKDSSSDDEHHHNATSNISNINHNKPHHLNSKRDGPPPPIRNLNSSEKNKNRELPQSISKKRKETPSNAKPIEPMDETDNQSSPKPTISRGPPNLTTFDFDYINQLKALHRKINDLRDRDILQRIVDIIEETGLFSMNNSAFDFDLMQLDRNTVRKIRQCLIST